MKCMLAVYIFLLACGIASAQQAEVKNEGTRPNYRELVKGLVSPNRPIKCDSLSLNRTISIPPNYDWNAQRRIEKNRQILFDHCEEALPSLIEGCTDSRYSLVSKWSEDDDFYVWSVGRVCLEILSRHVEAFRHEMRFPDPHRWHQYNFVPIPNGPMSEAKKKTMQEWWRQRKGMSLRELQLEAFDWAIEKRKQEPKRGPHPQNKRNSDDELNRLVSARDKLRQGHKPLPDGVMWVSLLSPPEGYTLVPWTEKGE